jgi:DNA repair protein RecO (recombination protein O)
MFDLKGMRLAYDEPPFSERPARVTRTFSCRSLVLRARAFGESNREITFLTAREGILRATVFGGPKSRLRAQAAPYHEGTVWFYRDPAKDFFKVTDFDVQIWRPGLRESYNRSMAAAGIAETLLASHGGGGAWEAALNLAAGALDALETADEGAGRRITTGFYWKWAETLGLRPDLSCCAACGKNFGESEKIWYSRGEEQFYCASCTHISEEALELTVPAPAAEYLPLSAGTRRWLLAAETLPLVQLTRRILDRPLQNEAKALCTAILSAALGKRLSTWDW